MLVRIGVHTGEPELTAGGYYVGVDLTRGARICAAAHGGRVALSQATRDLAGEGVEVRDLGDYRLKGIPQPERLFQLVAPGLRFDFPPLQAQRLGNLGSTQPHRRPARRAGRSWRPSLDCGADPDRPGWDRQTRLAVEVARTVAPSYADGAFFVGLAAVDDPVAVPAAVVGRSESARSPASRRPKRSHEVSGIASSCSCWTTSSASSPRHRSSPS